MAVPYTFQTQTGSIPLAQLDANFATAITIGSTAVYLGDSLTNILNATVNGLSFSTTGTGNIGVGTSISAITTGTKNIAIGSGSLSSMSAGSRNTVVGYSTGFSATGYDNTIIGDESFSSANSSGQNTIIGSNSLTAYTGSTGNNTSVGYNTFTALTTGQKNTAIGWLSGSAMTTGSSNAIFGGYTGNQSSMDIRTKSNVLVLSDGDGNPRIVSDSTGKYGYPPGIVTSVTQATNRTTGVTLNTPCGQVILFSTTPTLNTWFSFTVTNSAVKANDLVSVSVLSSTHTYIACVSKVTTGSFQISCLPISVTTGADAPYIGFAVIGASQPT